MTNFKIKNGFIVINNIIKETEIWKMEFPRLWAQMLFLL